MPVQTINSTADLKILLVDDDESIRRSLDFYFRRRKVVFASFRTAEEALSEVRDHGPELVITDYSLPGLNGLQFIEKLNRIDPGVMKILITAFGNLDVAIEAMKLGVHDFIRKPFNVETLETAIDALIRRTKVTAETIFVNGTSLEEADALAWRRQLELTVATASHQMNNSLFGIQGMAELGLLTTKQQEPLHANLLHIMQEVQQLTRLNNGLLSLCRDAVDVREQINIQEVIRECIDRFRHIAAKGGIEIFCVNGSGSFAVEASLSQVRGIVENLLVNAIQELLQVDKPEKRILVTLDGSPSGRRVTITDNGNGIDPTIVGKLCLKGFTTKSDGHGLGLYIVKSLAESLGASFDIRSIPGGGTSMEVRFRRAKEVPARYSLS